MCSNEYMIVKMVRSFYQWTDDVDETESSTANDDDTGAEDENDEGEHENSNRAHESKGYK